jgi:gamma-glutamylcyclotransferase (GGCT)/AIG2-like uncharacterized protein YtfP
MSQRVFVYGTLMRGGSNHRYLHGQRFVAEGETEPRYALYDLGGYPGMVETTDEPASVPGEIWEVSAECLAELDLLESIDEGEYARVWLKEVDAFCYLYQWPVDLASRLAGDRWSLPCAEGS